MPPSEVVLASTKFHRAGPGPRLRGAAAAYKSVAATRATIDGAGYAPWFWVRRRCDGLGRPFTLRKMYHPAPHAGVPPIDVVHIAFGSSCEIATMMIGDELTVLRFDQGDRIYLPAHFWPIGDMFALVPRHLARDYFHAIDSFYTCRTLCSCDTPWYLANVPYPHARWR